MTVPDPIIHVKFGPSEVVLAGTPDEYVVRSNNDIFTKMVKDAIKTPSFVVYGNKEHNVYVTGDSTMEKLFLSVISALPGQAIVVKAPEGVYERFWDEQRKAELYTVDNSDKIPSRPV